MRRSVLCGLAAAACAAFASSAQADNLAGQVGNTAVCTTPDGSATKVYFDTASTFVLTLPNGQTISGTAKDDGSQLCYTETNPAPAPGTAPVCTPSVARKVGDTWTVSARDQNQSCVLKAGKQ